MHIYRIEFTILEDMLVNYKGRGGCGRFWNLPVCWCSSLLKKVPSFLFWYDESQKLGSIGTKEKFYYNLNNADKSQKTANFMIF